MLSFGNPLGFLALLGIPAVLAIHLLQQKSRLLTVSTLFLLEQFSRESIGGSRVERLRNSIPLWLQLLMVLAVTWLLVQPRWMRKDAVQRVGIVIDSSASMSVYREGLKRELEAGLGTLATLVNRSEYVVLESRLGRERLYNGSDRAALLDALEGFDPVGGAHDFVPALRAARSLIGPEGVLVLVTDHPLASLPYETKVLSIGQPAENVGFAGLTIDDEEGVPLWKGLVRNYGQTEQRRRWWLESEGQRTGERTLVLAPGVAQTLQGPFPEGVDRATLILEGDAFTLDDTLPMIRPKAKELKIWRAGEAKPDDVYGKLFRSYRDVLLVPDPAEADLTVIRYNPLDPVSPPTHACIFVDDPLKEGSYLKGEIVSTNHKLMENLTWQGLLCRDSLRLPARDSDEVLLWIGDQPMIFLRHETDKRQLGFAFDLDQSNAARLPAFVVLIHRFLEGIREEKLAPENRNAETGQDLAFAYSTGEGAAPLTLESAAMTKEFTLADAALIDAPPRPGFFRVLQGENGLIDGAAHFADTREADFRESDAVNELGGIEPVLVERHSRQDSWWRLWTLVVTLVLLASWYFSRPVSARTARTETA
jgi:hypothetical protein